MMCKYCNSPLTDEEATEKLLGTDEYLDECLSCSSDLAEDIDDLIEDSYGDY